MAENALANNRTKLIAKRNKVLETMCPALRNKLDWVIDWMTDEARHNVMRRYDLGEVVKEIYEDESKNGASVYGKKAIQKISLFLDEGTNLIRTAMHLVDTYSRPALESLLNKTMADGRTTLSYSHIRCLVAIPTKEQRKEVTEYALANCLTVSELEDHVRKLFSSPRPGRPAGGIPKTVDGVITQQMQFAEDWETRYVKVWNDQRHSLVSKVDNLETEDITEDLATRLLNLSKKQKMIADQATKLATQTERKYQDVKKLLDKRGGGITPVPFISNPTDELSETAKPKSKEQLRKELLGSRK